MANYYYFLLYALVRAKYFYVMDADRYGDRVGGGKI